MDSIKNIKKYNIDLYNKLTKLHCKATYNGKLLYEGYYNDNYKTNKDKSCIVLEFTLPNDKKYMCLEEENKNINKLKKLINNFDDIYNDYKLYNEAVTLTSNLPLYNICEDKSIIRKGDSIVKIYENLNV